MLAKPISYSALTGSQIEYLDTGGALHIQDYWGSRAFLEEFASLTRRAGQGEADFKALFIDREVPSLRALGAATRILKRLVHNHAFAMAMVPLIQRLGCDLDVTHIDCGVLRYQLLNDLRTAAKASGYFAPEDFQRIDPRAIAEIFGYDKLAPHRDVRWPHIRILGFWMTLTDLEEGETLTLFPDVFSRELATADPMNQPFPSVSDPSDFGLGRAYSPAMKAGDLLVFHAGMVHSSPVRQIKTLRGSIDFRVAYPCLDDFQHYKWTFIQARNLLNSRSASGPVDAVEHRQTLKSLVDECAGTGNARQLSMKEVQLRVERTGESVAAPEVVRHAFLDKFCPDTLVWMLSHVQSRLCRFLILGGFAVRSTSYFWLYKAWCEARKYEFRLLSMLLRRAARRACLSTKLQIVNVPIVWPGKARELLPEQVLEELAAR